MGECSRSNSTKPNPTIETVERREHLVEMRASSAPCSTMTVAVQLHPGALVALTGVPAPPAAPSDWLVD